MNKRIVQLACVAIVTLCFNKVLVAGEKNSVKRPANISRNQEKSFSVDRQSFTRRATVNKSRSSTKANNASRFFTANKFNSKVSQPNNLNSKRRSNRTQRLKLLFNPDSLGPKSNGNQTDGSVFEGPIITAPNNDGPAKNEPNGSIFDGRVIKAPNIGPTINEPSSNIFDGRVIKGPKDDDNGNGGDDNGPSNRPIPPFSGSSIPNVGGNLDDDDDGGNNPGPTINQPKPEIFDGRVIKGPKDDDNGGGGDDNGPSNRPIPPFSGPSEPNVGGNLDDDDDGNNPGPTINQPKPEIFDGPVIKGPKDDDTGPFINEPKREIFDGRVVKNNPPTNPPGPGEDDVDPPSPPGPPSDDEPEFLPPLDNSSGILSLIDATNDEFHVEAETKIDDLPEAEQQATGTGNPPQLSPEVLATLRRNLEDRVNARLETQLKSQIDTSIQNSNKTLFADKEDKF